MTAFLPTINAPGRHLGVMIWQSARGWNWAERFAPADSRLCQDMAIVRGAGFASREQAVAASETAA